MKRILFSTAIRKGMKGRGPYNYLFGPDGTCDVFGAAIFCVHGVEESLYDLLDGPYWHNADGKTFDTIDHVIEGRTTLFKWLCLNQDTNGWSRSKIARELRKIGY